MQFDSGKKKDMLKQVFEMREEFMHKICAQIPDAYQKKHDVICARLEKAN